MVAKSKSAGKRGKGKNARRSFFGRLKSSGESAPSVVGAPQNAQRFARELNAVPGGFTGGPGVSLAGSGFVNAVSDEKIERLIRQDPLFTIKQREKAGSNRLRAGKTALFARAHGGSSLGGDAALLWEYGKQGKLVARPEALPKFLLAVDWCNPDHARTAIELMARWKAPEPINALQLLDASFGHPRVRQYAVRCLEPLPDEDLAEFLLQLTQVLKYEPFHDSPLAHFLLRRALRNVRLIGMRLFWHLRSEMHLPQFSTRFGLLLRAYLTHCGAHRQELTQQHDVQQLLQNVADAVQTAADTGRVKGKSALKQFCRAELRKLDAQLPPVFPLCLDPRMVARGLDVDNCTVMMSAKKPLWLVMKNVDSPERGGENIHVMFKSGDDLRQDQMTLQLLRCMKKIWVAEGVDMRLTPYGCVSTGDEIGMLQCVMNAKTVNDLIEKKGTWGAFDETSIYAYLKDENKSDSDYKRAVQNFVHSCAAYTVAMYVMGVGDRHSDNMMVKKDGHIFHIDFGHFLGHFKTKKVAGMKFNRERSPFVFTKEMAFVMYDDSIKSRKLRDQVHYQRFARLCCAGYNALRKHGHTLINLFRLMIPAAMPELTTDQDITYMLKVLDLDLTDEQAADKFKKEIEASLSDTYRRMDNWIHANKDKLSNMFGWVKFWK